MRLSRISDLSLRALMYLGARCGRNVPVREIAEAFDVSGDHLSKALQSLRSVGVVESLPGRSGGFRITRPTREIRVGEVVRAIEPSMAMAECFEPETNRCPLASACLLAQVLVEARTRFLETLDRYTVAELVSASRSTLIEIEP